MSHEINSYELLIMRQGCYMCNYVNGCTWCAVFIGDSKVDLLHSCCAWGSVSCQNRWHVFWRNALRFLLLRTQGVYLLSMEN